MFTLHSSLPSLCGGDRWQPPILPSIRVFAVALTHPRDSRGSLLLTIICTTAEAYKQQNCYRLELSDNLTAKQYPSDSFFISIWNYILSGETSTGSENHLQIWSHLEDPLWYLTESLWYLTELLFPQIHPGEGHLQLIPPWSFSKTSALFMQQRDRQIICGAMFTSKI